jgi:hypothetical protein
MEKEEELIIRCIKDTPSFFKDKCYKAVINHIDHEINIFSEYLKVEFEYPSYYFNEHFQLEWQRRDQIIDSILK